MHDTHVLESRKGGCWLTLLVLLAAVSLAVPDPALAATFVVNSTGDGADSDTADGVCNDGIAVCGAGTDICCTLRAAIGQSNATVGQDTIEFDIPPLDSSAKTIAPATALPNITDTAGVIVDGYTQDDATPNASADATDAELRVVLDGTGTVADGLRVLGGNSTIQGLVIHRFTGDGIELNTGDNNVIAGNFIGTDVTGTADMGNANGIFIANTANDSTGNLIGGTSAAARNLLSGNTDAIESAPGFSPCGGVTVATVHGNLIGTQRDGSTARANSTGLFVSGNCNQIGGTAAGARNLISGNGTGMWLFGGDFNVIEGNFIGTDRTGEIDLGNTGTGVFVQSATANTIGGTAVASRNVISGNNANGIGFHLSGTTGNFVYGNYIGTDVDGMSAVPNGPGGSGVSSNQAPGNTIGGPLSGQRNVISGNVRGVSLGGAGASGNIVQGNSIGVGADGVTAIANTLGGVFLNAGASNNLIGGAGEGEGNLIASNTTEGIDIDDHVSGTGNAIRGNVIRSNSGLGIDIGPGGVTPNDSGDADTGANNLQNFPLLVEALTDGASLGIDGSLNSTASTTFTLEFFASETCDGTGNGEGDALLGADEVTTGGSGDVGFSFVYAAAVPAGYFITATATDPDGNTSEFSACLAAGLEVCGNGVLELDEECDDGNVAPGDCCAADCTLDASGAACISDGNGCTDDECDGAGGCLHPDNSDPCSDGLFCTGLDTCAGGSCSMHDGDPCSAGPECAASCNEDDNNCLAAPGTACTDDANPCTDDECGSGACEHPPNAAACDDGLFCNGADTCSGGSCSVHPGDPCSGGAECANACNDLTDDCIVAPGIACTDDGNVCTDDTCDGAGSCEHPSNTAPCDDGQFCTGTEACSGGDCVATGDPCAGGAECDDACDELTDDCAEASGTPCSGDLDGCTDDECNGFGACVHPPNSAPCDDGSACTVGDTCSAGTCVPGAAPDCDDGSLCTVDSCDTDLGCQSSGEPRAAATCRVALKTLLQVKPSDDPARNKLKWKWSGGDAFDQAMLAAPDVETEHALCIYDTTASVPSLRAQASIAAGAAWTSKAPRGWSYVDKAGSSGGVQVLKITAGAATRTKVQLKASGANVEMPVPLVPTQYFAMDPDVFVQLVSSGGLCWTSEFSSAARNDAAQFKARTP